MEPELIRKSPQPKSAEPIQSDQIQAPPAFQLKANANAPIQREKGDKPGAETATKDAGADVKTVEAAPVIADKSKSAAAPQQTGPKEFGTESGDTKLYYVTDMQARIRDNDNPVKTTWYKILAPGSKVKIIREWDGYRQVEVVETSGNKDTVTGGKYWTSYSNLSASEPLNDPGQYWVPSASTAYELPGKKGKATPIAAETVVSKQEKVVVGKTTYFRIGAPGISSSYGFIPESDLKNAPKDLADNFDWMAKSSWDSSQATVNATDLTAINKNRAGVNDRTDKNTYKNTLSKVNKVGHAYADNAKAVKPEIEGKTATEKHINQIIFNTLAGEGSWSSINTWDGEVFSWGRGFSATGGLKLVFEELFKINPNYLNIFRSVGVDVVNGQLQVLDDKGNLLKNDPSAKKDKWQASEYIRQNTQLSSFFIELAEKKDFRKDVAQAQYNVIRKTAGKWPSYVMSTTIDGYADNWNDSSVVMIAYLSHWLSAGSWASVSYQDTGGDMSLIIQRYINKCIPHVGKKAEEGTQIWNPAYTLIDKLKHMGSPKGDAYAHFDKTWAGLSRDIEVLEFVDPISKKKKIYARIAGTDAYLKNVNLVPEGGGKYRAVLDVGDTDLGSHYGYFSAIGLDPATATKVKGF